MAQKKCSCHLHATRIITLSQKTQSWSEGWIFPQLAKRIQRQPRIKSYLYIYIWINKYSIYIYIYIYINCICCIWLIPFRWHQLGSMAIFHPDQEKFGPWAHRVWWILAPAIDSACCLRHDLPSTTGGLRGKTNMIWLVVCFNPSEK